MTIQVAIADDHAMFRQAMRRLLETRHGIDVVAEASTGSEAIEAVRTHEPQIVLLDIDMPDGDGIAAAEQIRRDHPQVGVVVLTMQLKDEYFRRSVQAGARGYVLKSSSSADVVRAIRTVVDGGWQYDPDMMARLIDAYHHAGAACVAPELRLTERQLAMLHLASTGASQSEIAEQFSLDEETIKQALTEIFTRVAADGEDGSG